MKISRIIPLFVLLFAATTAFSQQASIGLRTGASYFKVHYDDFETEPDYTMGLDIAIPVEFQLSSVFSIQPELHFTQKGVAFDSGEDNSIAVKTNYLELPVLLKARYGIERYQLYAFAAPSVGYATNRFVVDKTGDEREKEDLDFVTDGDIQDQRWEFGVVGGIGASFQAGVGSIVIDARYAMDLNDDTKFENDEPDDWKKATNRGCTLSVGYMIPIGR